MKKCLYTNCKLSWLFVIIIIKMKSYNVVLTFFNCGNVFISIVKWEFVKCMQDNRNGLMHYSYMSSLAILII